MLLLVLFISVLVVNITSPAHAGTTIEAYYPKDLGVMYLRGSDCGLSWDSGIRMEKDVSKDGTTKYSYSVECSGVMKDPLEVKVLIADRDWMLGANHIVTLTASSPRKNGSEPSAMFPWFYTYSGSLSKIENVYSKELNNFRDVIFYLPPSYHENTLKPHTNVLIMHDGQNLFNPLTSAFGTAWMCQDTLDDTIIQGKSAEVLIVGAYNTADRMDEYTYIYDPSEKAGGKGDLYLDWIESTLIPLVQENYRVEIVRDTLGILGSSLGGLISCYAGWTRSQSYGRVGCMSSSFWWDEEDFVKNVLPDYEPSDSGVPLPHIYMDSGTKESKSCTVYTTQTYNYCLSDGWTAEQNVFQYLDEGGEHNEASWGSRFHYPIEDLYPPSTV